MADPRMMIEAGASLAKLTTVVLLKLRRWPAQELATPRHRRGLSKMFVVSLSLLTPSFVLWSVATAEKSGLRSEIDPL